ncbi:MAG: sporulation protein YqfD [Clostridia bacterium]|nr:sporulation protein YqfD [Clostridia bacterium]
MIRISFKERLFGYADIILPENKERDYIDLFYSAGIIFRSSYDGGRVHIVTPQSELKHIKKLFGDDYKLLEVTTGGLPEILFRYKRRPGIVVGALAAVMISLYFSGVVWNIEVLGNESISDAYVIQVLEERGLVPGVRRSELDLDKLARDIVVYDTNIGFISVNFRGTCAYVEVKEYTPPARKNSIGDRPSNICADRDGVIVSVDVYNGVGVVKVGDTVKAGELLISGIVDSASDGYKLKSAGGRVIAEFTDTLHVEIPYKSEQKVATGRSKSEKRLVFFSKNRKILKNSGNEYELCDIIENKYRIEPFDKIKLPIELVETVYNEYTVSERVYTPEEARAIAQVQLESKLASLAKEGDITDIKINEYENGESYVISATVYRTADIAKQIPISVK